MASDEVPDRTRCASGHKWNEDMTECLKCQTPYSSLKGQHVNSIKSLGIPAKREPGEPNA